MSQNLIQPGQALNINEVGKLLSYLQQENEVLIERVRLLEISLAAEREACAKLAEEYPKRPSFAKFEDIQRASENIASLIRGREK